MAEYFTTCAARSPSGWYAFNRAGNYSLPASSAGRFTRPGSGDSRYLVTSSLLQSRTQAVGFPRC